MNDVDAIAGSQTDLSPANFARFAQYITGELGIKMPESKLSMVQSRLLRRVRELGMTSVDQYGEYFFASTNAEERDRFISAITTNKTDFFREPDHFEYLTRTAIPSLVRLEGGNPSLRLRVWSAGCSSGEEAYTLAMTLSEYARTQSGFDFAILGTDVSPKVLEHARSGIYSESQIEPVPPELRRRYFWRSRDKTRPLVRTAPELRRKTAFHRLNFMDDEYPIRDSFEVVFFRNVMIYFDKSTQQSVIRKICRRLIPGGYLFAGHSESLAGLDVPLKSVRTSIFRKPV